MCEEIFIVLNEVALSMNHEVTFVEPVEESKVPFSSRNLTSQGFLKPNSALYKEAKKRKKVMKNFLKAWQRDNNDGMLIHLLHNYHWAPRIKRKSLEVEY